jgi:hypothetical protein
MRGPFRDLAFISLSPKKYMSKNPQLMLRMPRDCHSKRTRLSITYNL